MPTEQSQLCNPRAEEARWKAPCAIHSCLQPICCFGRSDLRNAHGVGFVGHSMSWIRCNKPSTSLSITPTPFHWLHFHLEPTPALHRDSLCCSQNDF